MLRESKSDVFAVFSRHASCFFPLTVHPIVNSFHSLPETRQLEKLIYLITVIHRKMWISKCAFIVTSIVFRCINISMNRFSFHLILKERWCRACLKKGALSPRLQNKQTLSYHGSEFSSIREILFFAMHRRLILPPPRQNGLSSFAKAKL